MLGVMAVEEGRISFLAPYLVWLPAIQGANPLATQLAAVTHIGGHLGAPGQILKGIHGARLAADFEVKVDAGGPAGPSHGSDLLTLFHPLAWTYIRAGEMSIKGGITISTFDHDQTAVAAKFFADVDYQSAMRGQNRSVLGGREIDSHVGAPAALGWMSEETTGEAGLIDRPIKVGPAAKGLGITLNFRPSSDFPVLQRDGAAAHQGRNNSANHESRQGGFQYPHRENISNSPFRRKEVSSHNLAFRHSSG